MVAPSNHHYLNFLAMKHSFLLLLVSLLISPLSAADQTPASPIPEAAVIDPATAPPDKNIADRLEQIFSQIDDLSGIKVEVQAGVVTLAGEVPGKRSAEEALALASKVEGTVYVRNRLVEATQVAARVSPAVVKLRELGNRTVALLPVLGLALLIVVGFWLLGTFLTRRRGLFDFLGLSDLGSELARRVIRTLVVGLGIVIALEILDATAVVGAVLGIAGVAGVALGFAFRNIIENYLAGILLSTRNPFSIGDHVEIGAFGGKVVRLTSRDTVLMTLDGNHLRIPNSIVINKELINYSRNPLRRFDFSVGVSVDLDLTHVRSVGLATLRDLKGVLADPPPAILVEALGDSAVKLRFFAWIDQKASDFNKSRSEAIRTVKAAFDQAEIEMPEPIYRVHLRENSQVPTEKPYGQEIVLPPAGSKSSNNPAQADVEADHTIDKQLASDLANSEEPNLLADPSGG